jgi:NMD protein affecting ribosome stability and mRNA decay
MVYLEMEKPCDKCGAPAKWFYLDPRPGRRGLCDDCAPDDQKSTFE